MHARIKIAGLVVAGMLGISACKGAFEPMNMDAVTDAQLTGSAVIATLVNGVAENWAVLYDRLISETAVMSDEFIAPGPPFFTSGYTSMFVDSLGFFERSSTGPGTAEIFWQNFQTTRFAAEEAYNRVAASGPVAADSNAAKARVYSGMVYLWMGELMCDVAWNIGPAMKPAEALKVAETHLTESIAISDAANQPLYSQLAHLMRARARFDQGNTAGAVTDAQAVPTTFKFTQRPVRTGLNSYTYASTDPSLIFTLAPAYRNTGDPRVAAPRTRTIAGYGTLFIPTKYPLGDSPQTLGQWQEARLIEAEVALQAGNTATATSLINQVRAAANLPATTAVGAAALTTALRQERAYELFLEARRFQDMQRWTLTPPEFKATTRTFAQVCVPIPNSEVLRNPNLGTTTTQRQ